MRWFAAIVTAAIAVAAVSAFASEDEDVQTTEALPWLVGAWAGKEGDVEVDEHWIPAKGGMMMGVVRRFRRDRVTSFEYVRIEDRESGMVLVTEPGGRAGVERRIVDLGPGHVTFEDPDGAFPRFARYRMMKNGDLWIDFSDDIGGNAEPRLMRKLRPARPR